MDGKRERSVGRETYREGGKTEEQFQASFFSKSFLMKKECFLSMFELNLCTAEAEKCITGQFNHKDYRGMFSVLISSPYPTQVTTFNAQ